MNQVLISVAGSGLGLALVLRDARESAQVSVSGMSEEGGAETVQLIDDAGGEAFLCFVTLPSSRMLISSVCNDQLLRNCIPRMSSRRLSC
jgi:NAD(P)-dependent dehydrogenase (short-subunit alcohol dehydrogenase family)